MNIAHSELVDKIGPKVLRERYGLERQHIYGWRKNGVPQKYRVSVARLAAENGVAVPQDFFAGMVE